MSVENEQIKALIKVLNAGSPTNGQEDTEKRIAELLHAADDTTMEELLRNTRITTHVLLDALMRESLARVFASRPKSQWEKLSAEYHALSILHSCGMHPDHYSDIVKAAQGAKDMIQSFRGELADPPHDVQAAVLRKLGVEGYTGNEAPTCRIVAIESEQNPLSYPGIKLAGDGKYHGKRDEPTHVDCECKGWCRDGRDMISPHHPRCEHYTPPETDPHYAKFGFAMWKYITKQGGDFCGEEISEDILPLAQAAGLCCRVEYDPETHGEGIEADPGDEIWWWGESESEPIPVIPCGDEYYLESGGFRKITAQEYEFASGSEEAWILGETTGLHALVMKFDNPPMPWVSCVRHPRIGTMQRPTSHKEASGATQVAIEQLQRWKSKMEGGQA